MIKNSYQIFNCNEIESQFKLLSNADPGTINRINNELVNYHKHNEFDIQLENKNMVEQKIINNKFVFKNGYYFCSYLYNENNDIYISEPIFETSNNPICSKNNFTNIIIKNRIPLNLKIIGVVYYYKTLLDPTQCNSNMLFEEDVKIIHLDKEKYIIDIVYFNSFVKHINYELNYVHYKNINYTDLKKNKFLNKLRYYYFDKKEDSHFNTLTNRLDTKIYEETNTIIININNTRKKQFILQNLKYIVFENTNQNNLLNLLTIITMKNNNTITSCDNNVYSKHFVRVEKILVEIKNIINKLTKFINYNELVNTKYRTIFDAVYGLPDFSQMLLNPDDDTTFKKFKKVFQNIIEYRGKETEPSDKTIYGLKTLIFNILDEIDVNIIELNNNIIALRTKIGTSVEENNDIIKTLMNTVQEYIKLDIDMTKINENKSSNIKMEILMSYMGKQITLVKKNVLELYQKDTSIDDNYIIKELQDIFNSMEILENFKINKNNIIQIYNNIDIFYANLDEEYEDLSTYKTLYDIFFNKGNIYEDYLNEPHKKFDDFKKPYIGTNKQKKQLNYNKIFKTLPVNDPEMQNLAQNKIYDLENIKELNTSNIININTYCNKYSLVILKNIQSNYKILRRKIITNEKILQNICKTKLIVEEYKKNIEKFITSANFEMNTYKAQKKAKNFENLPANYRKGIEDFLNMNKINLSIIKNYITDVTYNISNNSYNIIRNTFNIFINSVIGDEDILIDDLDLLNIFFNMRNCFFTKEKNIQSIDDFIVIVYSLCISILAEDPKNMLDILFYMYDTNNDIKNLFDTVFNNKLYIYKTKSINIQTNIEEEKNNLKIISSIEEIDISEHSLNKNNIEQTKNKLNNIKNELISELKKNRFINIRKKLLSIQKFIGYTVSSDINTLKLTTNRGNYSIIENFFKNVEKMNIINYSTNINKNIDLNNYYSINNKEKNNIYCINLDSNYNYQCGPCDSTNRNALLKIRSPNCPTNLPYNLDTYINSHINSELGFNKDTYRIMSFISEPNKELIYKNNSAIKYGIKGPNDSYVWEVNKSYKNYILLDKTDTNEDETVIIKACLNNDTEHIKKNYDVTEDLNKLDKNENEFYLNNFYIENILHQDLKNEEWVKFPNSHQLYIEKPTKSNYYHIYFIENNIKYYMYLHIKKNKTNYDIIFRENTSRYKEPFILNNSKWRFIRTEDYIENIFDNVKILYNIRSKIYFNKSLDKNAIEKTPPYKIRGLLAKDNTCDNYATLLNEFFNNDEDLINNTKFQFQGYNNNYKITPYIKNEKSIFNNIDGCLFLNYNTEQKKLYRQKLKNGEIKQQEYDIKISKSKINTKVKLDPRVVGADPEKKLIYYKIQNPETLKYLYLDTTINKVVWSDLYDDTNKKEDYKITDEDILPDNFLWIVQNSTYNDTQIKEEIRKKQETYNNMIKQSIVNLSDNITNKLNKESLRKGDDYINFIKNNEKFKIQDTKIKNYIKNQANKTTRGQSKENIKKEEEKILKNKLNKVSGGEKISMTTENIANINRLVKKLEFIKYNDYKLLLKQLNLIKQISKNSLPSKFGHNNILNRMKLNYIDEVYKTNMSMYIYFTQMTKGSTKFECNINDILNFRSIEFYVDSNKSDKDEYNIFNFNNIFVEIDNDTYPEKKILINNTTFDNRTNLINNRQKQNNISINFEPIGTEEIKISQILINIPGTAELIINNRKTEVFVYYNSKPIFNTGKWLKPIQNTNKNNILNLLGNYGLSKKNKKIYDFSIRLQNTNSKINNIDKTNITEYIKSFNNEIGSFYIKKNELEESKSYTSKIFYIANNNQVIYIKIHNSNNLNEIYEAPCNYSTILEKQNITKEEIYSFICKSIYTHIQILNKKNKSENINKIFDYFNILYKNNKFNMLKDVLITSTRVGPLGYLIASDKSALTIEINMQKLNEKYELKDSEMIRTSKIPNKITVIFDRFIRDPQKNIEQYIFTNMKYTDFIHISNLFTIIPNIPFIKLTSFSENQIKAYKIFFDKIVPLFKYISNVKNNTEDKNIANIDDIINVMDDIINYYFIDIETFGKNKFNNILKLYLNTLLNSNISVTYYIIDLILDICHKIQNKYDEYSEKINELLKSDTRFIDCVYRQGNFIDILYNMVNYFSDPLNSEDPSFFNISYGFYFKKADEIYKNYVIENENDASIINRKYITSFSDIIKYYSLIEKNLPKTNIQKNDLNKPYFELLKKLNNDVTNILKSIFNMKYANIKINKKSDVTIVDNKSQTQLKNDLIEENKSIYLDYNNIDFNRVDGLRKFNKGDVLLFKFMINTKTNNLFNIINLYLPYKKQNNNWQPFTELIDINYTYKYLSDIIDKKLNIYGVSNYNQVFTSTLMDSYISRKNLLLKQILPFKNDFSSVEVENICYIKLENKKLYLYLNKYKYEVKMKKLEYSNLYLIYKTIHNINYYLEYITKDDIYNYEWIKEESHLVDKLINKLLFIDNTQKNITDTATKIDLTNEKMIEIEYFNRFSLLFSNINKFINNGDGECNLLDTYFTINNKTFNKIIHDNNIIDILDITLNNSDNTFILKDKYGKINNNVGNYKYYVANEECNSYIIYSPSPTSDDMIVLNNNFEFEKIPNNTLSLSNLINNPTINSKYVINLKYSIKNNIFEELDENCIKRDKGKKLKIQNNSDNTGTPGDKNKYFIYIINKDTGINKGIIDDYYIKENENLPERKKTCYIIPIKPINKLKILTKNTDGNYMDSNLLLKPIASDSEYYVIQNKKGEYLRGKEIIQYKKPLRINLEFVRTNIVNSSYLFKLQNNIENVESINILKTNKQCLTGGQKIISTNEIKEKYLTDINKKFNGNSKFQDLCHNNTNISFINYNKINTNETQDDVSYFDCRNSCGVNSTCSGFSMSSINGRNICNLYEKKPGTDDTSMIFYDCNRILTKNNDIGEIKKNILFNRKEEEVKFYNIDLVDNALYYIECKKNDNGEKLYVNLDKTKITFENDNNLNCTKIKDLNTETVYSNNIFRLVISKNNITNGNITFYSVLSNNNLILGSYKGSTNIKITYDPVKNKYIWNGENEKWYIEKTNDMYEYIVLESIEDKLEGTENRGKPDGFYCKYYSEGYRTMKVYKNNTEISVQGPDGNYTRIIPNEDRSIFKNIKNLNKDDLKLGTSEEITNYGGNIFAITNETSTDYYNLTTMFENKKFYLYLDTDNFIKFEKNTSTTNEKLSQNAFLWKFNLYDNDKNKGRSFQILKGGQIINQDILIRKMPEDSSGVSKPKTNKNNMLIGGVKLENLVNGNSYYIKSKNDEYICANKYYKNKDGSFNNIIAISIDSKLATYPNKNREYNKKFVRASIDLSETKYNIFKSYKIDDDIMWKLIIEENDTQKIYKFYNIKHDLYLKINDTNEFEINKTGSSIFYNIVKKNEDNINIIINNQKTTKNKIYTLDLINLSERNTWAFINPENYSNSNPYTRKTVFSNLENGKIYRIINQGVKNKIETNTYLTLNDLNNELLIPYNEKTFTNKLNYDETLWRCIINEDNTYSFEFVKTGQKLGDDTGNLFKNMGNKLNFKNSEYTIDKKYLTDRFYIQHGSNQYYNIINSKNLNYNVCGFSNDINTYDNYSKENIKYTHKIANNSEWLITNKLVNEYTRNDTFTNESYYYLYPSKTNKIHYSFGKHYNSIHNIIYNEKNKIITNATTDKKEMPVMKNNLSIFKKSNGFTIETKVECTTISSRKLGVNNISIILDTADAYYTIRFINYNTKSTLIRITETNSTLTEDWRRDYILKKNKQFDKLDKNGDKIDMKICAPDIYTDKNEHNLFYLDNVTINITYDNEFVNIYLNNKLITFFRKLDLSITQIYFLSFYDCIWNKVKWWSHNKLINIPIWKTENINNFIENKPGIRFTSKINKNVKLECYVKKHSENYFYIINNKNEFLSLVGTEQNNLNYTTEWSTNNSNSNCLWKLYDTNINLAKNINLIEGTSNAAIDDLLKHSFKCLKKSLNNVANIENENYLDDINNSTNIMVKAKINKTTKLLDETSNYIYSIIDINPDEDNLNYKKCYWTHNLNGHTSIDYNADDIGSFFTTDIWNIQFVLGVNPKPGDKFLVKYKSNKGIVRVDDLKNIDYETFGIIPTTARMRWLNWEKIKEFPIIKNQNNIYVENKYEENVDSNNICISKYTDNTSPSQFSASCFNVENRISCNNPSDSIENIENSVERLYLENKNCEDYMYKNYALIKASVSDPENNILTGGNNIQKGGNVWITKDSLQNNKDGKWYFYLEPKKNDKNIFTNIHNVKYYPNFNPPIEKNEKIKYDKEITNWTWTDVRSRNIILNRLLNDFNYDGYIEKINDNNSGIIRGIILPKNFVLFYKISVPVKTAPDGYIYGNFKAYNMSYKNIYIIKKEDYISSDIYSNYYVKIHTKIGNKLQKKDDVDNLIYKLNKCKELTDNRFCIPFGSISKTASNIKETNYLTQVTNILDKSSLLKTSKNDTEQLSTNHPFRIINIYGKYLCDIFVNDSQFCEYTSNKKLNKISSSEIMFQGQKNSINLIHKETHYIHSMSLESLWTFEKNKDNSYKLINTYTGKYLTKKLLKSNKDSQEIVDLYIEFAETKYFKQQISDINKKQTNICYANEDTYYIYYIENNKKMYLSFKDILINNKYNNNCKVGFIENTPTPFIIKPATRNLDQITDDSEDLPEIITNICYNRTKICDTNISNMPLFENNNLQCLNISYLFRKSENGESAYTNLNEYNVFNLINKNNDNFLSVPHKGYYDLMFYFPNIKINQIKFKFSGLFNPIKSYNDKSKNSQVSFIDMDKWLNANEQEEFLFKDIEGVPITETDYKTVLSIKDKNYFTVENSQISKEHIINLDVSNKKNDNVTNSIIHFRIYCEEGFTLNYIEAYGKSIGELKFKTEKEIINTTSNYVNNINIDKTLITKTKNIENNTVKIKYLTRSIENREKNVNLRVNNIYIKNNKPVIDNLNSTNFILVFNPLLNAYMFYINNNTFLSVDNVSYFKLINNKNDKVFNNNKNITYYFQSLHNSKLYININNSNSLVLGTVPQLFQLFKTTTPPVYQNFININNAFLNNILYNLDNRIIYMQVQTENIQQKQFYYLHIQTGYSTQLKNDIDKPIPILLKRSGRNEWRLTNISHNKTFDYIITDLQNSDTITNLYTFKHNGNNEMCYINLYYDYNTFNLRTYKNIKNLISHNDINKKISLVTTKHETLLKRNKNYINRKYILDKIYLHNIIKLQHGNKFLSYNGSLILSSENNNNNLFIQINLNERLCKLWHVEEKKFIIYNILSNKFTLSSEVTEYNDIDMLDDIDLINNNEFSIFEFYNVDRTSEILYTIAYYNTNGIQIHLNLYVPEEQHTYTTIDVHQYSGDYTNVSNITKNSLTYIDYCKICKSSNSVQDNLINQKIYKITKRVNTIFLRLGDYKMTIGNQYDQKGIYFKIKDLNVDEDTCLQNIPSQYYKESIHLKKLFNISDNTSYLKMYIVTISISGQNYNIIVWKRSLDEENKNTTIIGRFEDKFDKPGNYKGPHNIIFDANNNILDENNDKSYILSSYNKPPKGKSIKISNMNLDFIEEHKLSLFHYDNSETQIDVELTEKQKNTKTNTKKINTTCAWGECTDLDKIPMKKAQNHLEYIKQLENTYDYTQLGGKLDVNMIQFIKNVSQNKKNPKYHNIIKIDNPYVNKNTSFYNTDELLDILFKKNDIIEFYKIFGKNGWTNSYNSIYAKKIFTIDKNINDITDLDYYDTFRHIYPVSWLENKFAFNLENIWMQNYWFEDNPHFRSLPNWKFELVQAVETRNSDAVLQVKFGGNNLNNNLNLYNFIKNPVTIFIIIIIGILIFKKYLLN